jgi:hypothetical protein
MTDMVVMSGNRKSHVRAPLAAGWTELSVALQKPLGIKLRGLVSNLGEGQR